MNDDWTKIDYFNIDEFYSYLYTLPEEQQADELATFGKQQSMILLKDDMIKYKNFYEFIKNYSPRDYRIINNKPWISQRVINTHIQLWNSLHIHRITKLRVFFL